jgi:hypothetical protein
MNIVTEQKQMPERLFLGSGFGFGDAGADAGLITLAAGTLLRLGVLLAHCFFPSFFVEMPAENNAVPAGIPQVLLLLFFFYF